MGKWLWRHILCFFLAPSVTCSGSVLQALPHLCIQMYIYIYIYIYIFFFFQQSLAFTNERHLISNYCLAIIFFPILFWNSKLNDDLPILGWVPSSPWLKACPWLTGWRSHRAWVYWESKHTGRISHKCYLHDISIRFSGLRGKPVSGW